MALIRNNKSKIYKKISQLADNRLSDLQSKGKRITRLIISTY